MGHVCPSWDPLIPLVTPHLMLCLAEACLPRSPQSLGPLRAAPAQSTQSVQSALLLCDGFSEELFTLSGRDDPACSRGQLAMSEHSAVTLWLGHCHFVGGSPWRLWTPLWRCKWTDIPQGAFFALLFYFVGVKRGLPWPRQASYCYVAKEDLEFLTLLPLHAGLRSVSNHRRFIWYSEQNRGLCAC